MRETASLSGCMLKLPIVWWMSWSALVVRNICLLEMSIPSLDPRREASLLIMLIFKFEMGVIARGTIPVIV